VVYDILDSAVLLRVRLMPNSSSCRLNGIFVDAHGVEFLKISVISVPEKGKANKELIAWLAKKLGIAKQKFDIIGGELDRYKKIMITDEVESLIVKLNELIYGEK